LTAILWLSQSIVFSLLWSR